MQLKKDDIIKRATDVLALEAQTISNLANYIGDDFVQVVEKFLNCQGKVIVTGMGKSGHIGRKLAATLASTGTPSFFLHPGEASHGDLGMITDKDIVLALSNSGETAELNFILPLIKRLGVFLVSMTGASQSKMAQLSDIHLEIKVEQEACALGLAPTASTSAALAMGDALAIATLEARGFTTEDFARSHPGGKLGKRLFVTVKDLMHSGNEIPKVLEETSLSEALVEMTQKRLGMTTIVAKGKDKEVIGVFTDGDLRRTFQKHIDLHGVNIKDLMTTNFKTIQEDMLAAEALSLMDTHKINALPVVNKQNELVGALNMQDLLKAGVL